MGKLLFLSNSTKPPKEEYEFVGEEKLDNVSIPSVKAAGEMGIQVIIGTNRKYAKQMTCTYPVSFYNAEIYRNPFNIREVRQAYQNACAELRSDDYTAIHCNTPIGGFVGRVAGKKCNIGKVIYTAHGFHFYKGAPLFNRTVLKWAEMLMARWTDAIITMNQEDYEAAKKFKLRKGGKVYFVHGVGINLQGFEGLSHLRQEKRQELGLNNDDIMLISMGDLVARKNYATAIRAIARANDPRLNYMICGKGEELEKLQVLAKKLGVEKQVHFLGFRTDVKQLLTAADIFLFTTRQEGLPRSMMEAMASGLPCVASAIRGNVDLVENGVNGYTCNVDDVDGYAVAIETIVADPELRAKMRENNLEKIKQYDVSVVEQEMQKIYTELLPVQEKVTV